MELGALFLILALALLVGMYLSRPFLSLESEHDAPEGEPAEQQEDQLRSTLLAERDRLLSALQELDFDHYLGKIPEEDYSPQREALAHNTAEVLRRLDEIPPLEALEVPAVAAIPAAPVAVEPPDEKLELLIAVHRRNRLEKSVGFCPRCGKPVKKSDKFCSRCGMPIVL
ncbi:MAG: zinc ribbon domain-containing protein [Anaerolineaceae bacterium]|jgi:hypothetical protein